MTAGRPVVVSVTPVPMDRDTRTLKIAGSFARAGWRSIVIENLPSAAPAPEGIEVVPLWPGRRPAAASAKGPAGGNAATVIAAPPPSWRRHLRERLHFAAFALLYLVARPLAGLWQLPRADLYYLHEYRLFPMLRLACLLGRGAPIIYDAHDAYLEVWEPETLSAFWRRRFLPLIAWMERRTVAMAAATVTVSGGVAVIMAAQYGVQPVLIRNCHDQRLERRPTRTVREAAGVAPTDFLLAVVGNRKPGQALEPAIAALARLPAHVHIAFVGRFYDEVTVLAARHGVGGRAHAVGAVAPEEVVPFIRSADAAGLLYFPHSGNTLGILPNGFFQSLAAGLPLAYPQLPEILRVLEGHEAVGIAIDPRSVDSMASALGRMSTDPDARRVMAATAAALGGTVSWQAEERRLLDLARSLIARE